MSVSEASREEGEAYFKSMIEDVARIPALQVEERLQSEFDRLHDALAAQAVAGSSMTSSIDKLINQIGVSDAATQAFLKEFKLSLGTEIDSRFHSLESALSAGASDLSEKMTQSHSVLAQRVDDVVTRLDRQQMRIQRVLWSALLAGALAATDLILLLTRN